MRNYSWYTYDKPHISTYINGAPKKRYLVVDGIDVVGRAVMHFKPNMKGGYNRKDSHLLNVEGKNLFGKRWTKLKKYYTPKITLFNGVPKRFWLKLELTKIYYSMMSFVESQVINEISQMMLNRKKQYEKKQN